MSDPIDTGSNPHPRRWKDKFTDAGRGYLVALKWHSSFRVHVVCAVGVCVVGLWLNLVAWKWVALLSCVFAVLVMELINTSIEHLARAITREHHPEIARSLDVAAAAVLTTAIAAVVIGILIVL